MTSFLPGMNFISVSLFHSTRLVTKSLIPLTFAKSFGYGLSGDCYAVMTWFFIFRSLCAIRNSRWMGKSHLQKMSSCKHEENI
jgi:hypothetical protein